MAARLQKVWTFLRRLTEWKCLANECGTFPHKDLNSNEIIVQKWTLFFGPSARDEADDENGRPQWERDELISRGRRGDVAAKQQIKVSTAGNEAATCKRNGPQHPRFVIVASLMNQLVDWTVDMLMRGCETLDPVDIWHPADRCWKFHQHSCAWLQPKRK